MGRFYKLYLSNMIITLKYNVMHVNLKCFLINLKKMLLMKKPYKNLKNKKNCDLLKCMNFTSFN